MTITNRPKWSLGRGNAVVPSRWQATSEELRARHELLGSFLCSTRECTSPCRRRTLARPARLVGYG